MRFMILLMLPVLIMSSCARDEHETSGRRLELPDGFDQATQTVSADEMLTDISFLAADELEGRLPGSDGDRKARLYLAQRLAAMGFEPFFDGSFEQKVDIVGLTSHMPEHWIFKGPRASEASFEFVKQYMAGSGLQQPDVSISDAELVFVGYGIQAPEEDWDDFKDAELDGKVLLMLNDDPHWDEALFAGERKLQYGRWTYKYESAARQGAAGAIIIHTTPSAGYPWQVVRTSWLGEQFELAAGDEPRMAVKGWLTEGSARRLVEIGGHDLDRLTEAACTREFRPVPLGVTTSLDFSVDIREAETANVAGILRGSDPDLADEVVIFSAHHDHLGIGEPDETGDTIYNGALDNGVAMSQALAVGRAFEALPQRPRRSVMLFFPAAEEQGILGSAYFARTGAVHPALIAANINFELGNVWGRTRDVIVFGRGKSELEDWLAAAASTQDRVIGPENNLRAGWYYRSDQISFARVGAPSIWFKSGVDFIGRPEGWGEARYAEWIERHYHQPSDEIDEDWVLDGLVEDAQLAFMLGTAVATADVTPRWYPGDEFEATRKRALADLK